MIVVISFMVFFIWPLIVLVLVFIPIIYLIIRGINRFVKKHGTEVD